MKPGSPRVSRSRTPESPAGEARQVHAEVSPWLCAEHSTRIGRSWNSSPRSLGAGVGLGSPNGCRETHAPRLGLTGPGSFRTRLLVVLAPYAALQAGQIVLGTEFVALRRFANSFLILSLLPAGRPARADDADTTLAPDVCHK